MEGEDMTLETPGPLPVRASARRRVVVAGLLIGIFLLARWTFTRGKPQRLAQLPDISMKYIAGVRNETLYWVASSDPFVIKTMPVQGGPIRERLREKRGVAETRLLVGPDLYYSAAAKPWGEVAARARQTASEMQQTLMEHPGANLPKVVPAFLAPITVRRVNLADNQPPTDVLNGLTGSHVDPLAGEIRGPSLALVGSNLYWVAADPADRALDKDERGRASFRSALRTAPISDPTRVRTLATGLSPWQRLTPYEDGVCWNASQRPDEPPGTLHYASASVSNPRPWLYSDDAVPVALADRRYWLRTTYNRAPDQRVSSGATPARRQELMRANADGTDARVLLTLSEGSEDTRRFTQLTAYRGALYCVMNVLAQQDMRLTFCRLRLTPTPTLQKLCVWTAVPEAHPQILFFSGVSCFFDDDYVYYLVAEEHENWFDWLARNQQLRLLYRCRLPDRGDP